MQRVQDFVISVDLNTDLGSKHVDPGSKTPYSDATNCRKQTKHVRRPMNPYMVWSQIARRKILVGDPNMHNAVISKLLGAQWKKMTSEEKRPFVEEARKLKELHERENPDYKYQPRKRARAKTAEETTHTATTVDRKLQKISDIKSDQERTGCSSSNKVSLKTVSLGKRKIPVDDLPKDNTCGQKQTVDCVDRSSWYSPPLAKMPYSPEEAVGSASSPEREAFYCVVDNTTLGTVTTKPNEFIPLEAIDFKFPVDDFSTYSPKLNTFKLEDDNNNNITTDTLNFDMAPSSDFPSPLNSFFVNCDLPFSDPDFKISTYLDSADTQFENSANLFEQSSESFDLLEDGSIPGSYGDDLIELYTMLRGGNL